MFRDVNGVSLFTVAFGQGPRTLVAHGGFAGNWELFSGPMQLLNDRWRTISYDHRGAGESVAPVDAITGDAMVADLFGVLDAFAVQRCVMVGESAGTVTALRAVLEQPERFEGLVFIDGGGGVTPPNAPPRRTTIGLPSSWPGDTFEDHMRWFAELCVPASEPNAERCRRWATDILVRAGPDAADALWQANNVAHLDLAARLPEVRVPTLLIAGTLDPLVSRAGQEYLAATIPHARLVWIDGAGHVPSMTRPREVAAAINDFFGA